MTQETKTDDKRSGFQRSMDGSQDWPPKTWKIKVISVDQNTFDMLERADPQTQSPAINGEL